MELGRLIYVVLCKYYIPIAPSAKSGHRVVDEEIEHIMKIINALSNLWTTPYRVKNVHIYVRIRSQYACGYYAGKKELDIEKRPNIEIWSQNLADDIVKAIRAHSALIWE